MNIRRITGEVAVAGQLQAKDLARVASLGFRSVINNRPDGEEDSQPRSAALAAEAIRRGLVYREQPVVSGKVRARDAAAFGRLIRRLEGPVLAFCRSGTRSITLWALDAARRGDVEGVLSATFAAGYDLESLRRRLSAMSEETA